jgi:pentose-5-phosphate-3-epimerase
MPWNEWIRTVEIEPALDAVDAAALEPAIDALLRTGCRIFHVHVRQGIGASAVEPMVPLLHRYEGILDVHVRSEEPAAAFSTLAAAGADSITFDAESVEDAAATIQAARALEVQVGIAFRPDVPVEDVAAAAEGADLVLWDGEGDHIVESVRRLAGLLPRGVEIQVEGDVTFDNLRSLHRAGARLLVVHAPIFEREDLPRAYRRLVQALA